MPPLRKRKSAPLASTSSDGSPESGERKKAWDPGPYSDEPEMEGYPHMLAFVTLFASFNWHWRERKDWFGAGNLSIYYPTVSPRTGRKTRKKLSFRGPDFFIVLGVDPSLPRNSWVVENEGKYPDVIVEFLSKSTARNDRGIKKQIYERIFKTPEYFLFDPLKYVFEGFRLVKGRYVPIKPEAAGRLWSEQLKLAFGVHQQTLRLFEADGSLVPLADESAMRALMERNAERARAKRAERETAQLAEENARLAQQTKQLAQHTEQLAQEKAQLAQQTEQLAKQKEQLAQKAAQADEEKERLLAKLRALGIDPERL